MSKSIELTTAHNVKFPTFDKKKGNVLILGNFDGVIGKSSAKSFFDLDYHDVSYQNLGVIIDAIKSNKNVYVIGEEKCTDYFRKIMGFVLETGVFESASEQKFRNMLKAKRNTTALRNHFKTITTNFDEWATGNNSTNFNEDNEIYKTLIASNMKFDTIIQNPPFNGSLHLDFLEKGLELLNPNGKMVIIEPATWLDNLNPNSDYVKGTKTNHTPKIKEKIEGHVESVIFENLNKEFGTEEKVLFAITTIDMSKTFETIDFKCCGEHRKVASIFDCNTIGKRQTIENILHKTQSFGDMMKNHISKSNMASADGLFYNSFAGYISHIGWHYKQSEYASWNNDKKFINNHFIAYYECATSDYIGASKEISKQNGNEKSAVFGTIDEITNWKHFILNNKLPLFINICLIKDEANNSKRFLPWLVDKQYTDDEINEMFGFTDEEIKLIDTTIKKYERNSPWFKRYMCGKDSVTDDEVNNFIEKLMREC